MSVPRFLDTNILLYSISRAREEIEKRMIAELLLDSGDNSLSIHVLQEFYVEATRPTRADALPHDIAAGLTRTWQRFRVQEITLPVMLGALEIKAAHRLAYWDALIVSAARALGCREILSEDLAHGREMESMVVVNPFR